MIRKRSFNDSIVGYLKVHQASLGSLLLAYGVFFLAAVIMSGWIPSLGQDVFNYPQSTISVLMPRSYISLIFFTTSFPSMLIGIALLCLYTISILRRGITADSKYVAIILTTFGFAYQILGAWPLGNPIGFQWEWQKQIMNYGPFFAWLLYSLSLLILGLGAVSLYVHSKANCMECSHSLSSIPMDDIK